MTAAILLLPDRFPSSGVLILGVLWFILGPLLFVLLWSRISRLERRLVLLEGRRQPETSPLAAAPQPTPPGTAAAPRLDWENTLAGHWLNRIGILALLFGVAFFLRYAFQSGWIGPTGRVLTGLLAGV